MKIDGNPFAASLFIKCTRIDCCNCGFPKRGRRRMKLPDHGGFAGGSFGPRIRLAVRLETPDKKLRLSLPVIVQMKARQAAKIRELGHALVDAGFLTLDEQSKALGLARSTTWTILRASHKGSGLSAAIIKRMLLSPQLPPLARRKILEYTTDKLAGAYGGSRTQRLKFFERVKQLRLDFG
jgi:hypothetical protein